ncbi:MAG: CAP domain-containing protein [bacterium]|nr:CAP domain-containing protein [bacterium]
MKRLTSLFLFAPKSLTLRALRNLGFSSIVVFAYVTGLILPYPNLREDIPGQKTRQVAKSSLLEKKAPSQLNNERIFYKKAKPQVFAAKDQSSGQWGVAKQVGEHTWTINVGNDATIGTSSEILNALNSYRNRHGVGSLSYDQNLFSFAQGRADAFHARGSTDAHAGFTDLINNQDGFKKLGFMALGENSSFGYHVAAVHLIEWVYAGDAPHDNNQLNPQWTHVGIGVAGLATDLIFGGRKM